MRFKTDKSTIMNEIRHSIEWKIKEKVIKLGNPYNNTYRELSDYEKSLITIIRIVTEESIQVVLENIYTDEEFEKDINLR